ncbi:hypothetical protein LUZ60_007610 [Juncus effusus]|nr:hypothetical protein LUZ60_007610 [Juncus effusus]
MDHRAPLDSAANSGDPVRPSSAGTGGDNWPDMVILDEDEEDEDLPGGSILTGNPKPGGEEGINFGNVKTEIDEFVTDNKEKESAQVNNDKFERGKVLEVSSEDDELEIIGVNESKVKTKPKPLPLVSCVAWRTRLSHGKQDRVSYSTYFQKISDDSSDEKDDDKKDKDIIQSESEEEEEQSSESGSDLEKSEPDLDEDTVIGDWWERKQAKKRRFLESSEGEDQDQKPGFGFPDWKKPRNEIPDEVHVIESDVETDFGSGPALRSASSDSDWETEKTHVTNTGFGTVSSNSTKSYRSRTGTSRPTSNHRSYYKSMKYKGSGSKSKSRSHSSKKYSNNSSKKYSKRSYSSNNNKSYYSKGPKGQELMSLLVEKMSGEANSDWLFDDPSRYGLNDVLPMVFSFDSEEERESEERESEEREEEVREMNELWADYEFALESENIGVYHHDECLAKDDDDLATQFGYCPNGKHDFILDEQIGVVCKNCPFVSEEIRYILPALATGLVDKSSYRNSTTDSKTPLTYNSLSQREQNQETESLFSVINGTIWDLIPGIFNTMYPHQREAIEFMWNNLAGSLNLNHLRDDVIADVINDVIGGCVVCHAPGTGKTRLAIVFLQTYVKVFPDCRPVIIAPSGMLYTWEEEFKKWNVNIPFHILNNGEFTGKEDSGIRKLVRNESKSEKLTRLVKLYSWDKGNGILGVSYGLFKKLTSDKCKKEEDLKIRNVLLEKPGLLVLDEGHTPRNEKSIIWKTLGKVKSGKRIILSGTPFQNNFLELYNILCLVRPQFAERFLIKRPKKRGRERGKEREILLEREKEGKGIWASITNNVTDDNAEQVRSILKPFVHIHNGNILQTLPGLRESVVILNPSSYQKEVIRKMESIGTGCNFENEYKISLASIHPSLVTAVNMTQEEAKFLDVEELEKLRLNPNEGVKIKFVMEVVRLCEVLREKVLIFSQFIQPLSLIKKHLIRVFKWREEKEILQMDGKILPKYRQASIDIFNNPNSEARVLLASTRACCEGISLTGASRVVLLDVVWNPAVGRQAISRAYRIGQQKFVYTYNLITFGTSEVEKYDRQAVKDHLSKLVFAPETDLNNVRNTLTEAEEQHSSKLVLEDRILSAMTSHWQLKDMFERIYYPPTDANIVYTYNQIVPESEV